MNAVNVDVSREESHVSKEGESTWQRVREASGRERREGSVWWQWLSTAWPPGYEYLLSDGRAVCRDRVTPLSTSCALLSRPGVPLRTSLTRHPPYIISPINREVEEARDADAAEEARSLQRGKLKRHDADEAEEARIVPSPKACRFAISSTLSERTRNPLDSEHWTQNHSWAQVSTTLRVVDTIECPN